MSLNAQKFATETRGLRSSFASMRLAAGMGGVGQLWRPDLISQLDALIHE